MLGIFVFWRILLDLYVLNDTINMEMCASEKQYALVT